MTVSTRLSSHTKSSLAKASPPRQKPKKSSGDSGNSNETSVKKSSTVVQTENGTPKLQHSRAPSRKTSTFVTAVEERIAEAKEKRNEKPKFPAVPKFQSTEISPKNKPITEGPMLRDDFTLGDGISCEEEHLFRPSLEFKFEFKGDSSHLEVLSKSLDRKVFLLLYSYFLVSSPQKTILTLTWSFSRMLKEMEGSSLPLYPLIWRN